MTPSDICIVTVRDEPGVRFGDSFNRFAFTNLDFDKPRPKEKVTGLTAGKALEIMAEAIHDKKEPEKFKPYTKEFKRNRRKYRHALGVAEKRTKAPNVRLGRVSFTGRVQNHKSNYGG